MNILIWLYLLSIIVPATVFTCEIIHRTKDTLLLELLLALFFSLCPVFNMIISIAMIYEKLGLQDKIEQFLEIVIIKGQE